MQVVAQRASRRRKRWIDTVKICLKKKKKGLDVRQARRMVHDRSEWWGFVRENTIVVSCHETLEWWKWFVVKPAT